MKLYNIDLNNSDQTYAFYSGWFLSKEAITSQQKNSLINLISEEHQNLGILTYDGEGEDLDDYCDEFKYFDLEKLNNGQCVVVTDLNYLEEYDSEIDNSDVFLTNEEDSIILIEKDGSITYLN